MKRREGFTLGELLVIAPLIMFVAVLLLPTLNDAKETLRRASCASNLRQIGLAINLYAVDHNDYYPPGFVSTVGDWPLFIAPYMAKTQTTYGPGIDSSKAFLCPSGVLSNGLLTIRLMYSAHPRMMPSSSYPSFNLYKRSRVARPSELVLVADGTQQSVLYAGDFDADPNFDGVGVSKIAYNPTIADQVLTMQQLARDNTDGNPGDVGVIRLRHFNNTAANFLFCDSHVELKMIGQLKARNFMYDP
jgi:prepilin-type processing-associated H-X9-DG protein